MQVNHSIGNAIYMARIQLKYDDVYAWTIILLVLSLGIEGIGRFLKKKTMQ